MRVEIRRLTKTFGAYTALDEVSLDVARRRVLRAARALRLGQDDAAAHHRRARVPRSAARSASPARTWSRRDARERQVGFVFQHYALFRHMTVFENVAFGLRVRPRRARPAEAQIRERVIELLRLVQLEAPREPLSEPALGRPAPARGARPRARDRAAHAAARRAVRRARRQGAQGAAPLAARAAPTARPDQRVRHPRPGGGARARRPGRRDERGPDRADRQPARRSTTARRRRSSTSSWAAPTGCPAGSGRAGSRSPAALRAALGIAIADGAGVAVRAPARPRGRARGPPHGMPAVLDLGGDHRPGLPPAAQARAGRADGRGRDGQEPLRRARPRARRAGQCCSRWSSGCSRPPSPIRPWPSPSCRRSARRPLRSPRREELSRR